MKELGAYLKEQREENGITIGEASDDLRLKEDELDNIEAGNTRAFKDIYALRDMIKKYAKYLGLDVKEVAAEFNDFLFEHTSKISLDDITAAAKEKDNEDKEIKSPYTKNVRKKIDIAPVVLCILLCILIGLIIYLLIGAITSGSQNKKTSELKGVEVYYESTY